MYIIRSSTGLFHKNRSLAIHLTINNGTSNQKGPDLGFYLKLSYQN